MKKTKLSLSIILFLFWFNAIARENTMHVQNLTHINNLVEIAAISVNDSVNNKANFNDKAITITGFQKRVSDSSETFFVKNATTFAITRVKLRLRYSDVNGKMLHERIQLIDCDIPAGETRQLSIPSFDRQRAFYYFLSPKPRKQATAFKVAFELQRYDIKIEP